MVRKIFAILLLALFVFNIIGYKIVVMIELQKADTDLEALLDSDAYQNEDLFTLKIPINLPYQNSKTSFERIDGEITVNGEPYKFVQRRVENDTVYLQCIKHTGKINVEQKASDYFGKMNDVAGNNPNSKNSSGKNSSLTKYSSQDFLDDFNTWNYTAFSSSCTSYLIKPFTNKGSEHLQLLIKPPQLV